MSPTRPGQFAIGYAYDALASAFDRADAALPGFAAYFRDQADSERGHARGLMAFQATRGGVVQLGGLAPPGSDLGGHASGAGQGVAPGDAARAMEAALSLERMNYECLEARAGCAGCCGFEGQSAVGVHRRLPCAARRSCGARAPASPAWG